MSNPEDIPQDVHRKALRLALEYRASVLEHGSRPHDLTDAFASAIMAAKTAEREEIAAFCASQAPTLVGELFAAAIRERGRP